MATPGSMIDTGATPGGCILGFWKLGLWKLGFGMRGENCGAPGGGTGADTGRKEGADGGMEGGAAAEIGGGVKDWMRGGGGGGGGEMRLGFGLGFSVAMDDAMEDDGGGCCCGGSASDFSGLESRVGEEDGDTAMERESGAWFFCLSGLDRLKMVRCSRAF